MCLCERRSGEAARENRAEAMRAILGELARRAELTLGDGSLDGLWPGILEKLGPDGASSASSIREDASNASTAWGGCAPTC